MLIPYIDLQLSGIQDTLRVAGTGYINVKAVVILSFFLVALYTFFSGIKGPTYAAIIKDILVWAIGVIYGCFSANCAFWKLGQHDRQCCKGCTSAINDPNTRT